MNTKISCLDDLLKKLHATLLLVVEIDSYQNFNLLRRKFSSVNQLS